MEDGHAERTQRVTPLELFFDLVFVFAITQVTGLMSEQATWEGILNGMLVLAALWWAWAGYAWLTNSLPADGGAIRLAMIGAMAAMLVASLAVPDAFGRHALLFAGAYALVRVLHLVLYAIGSWGDRDMLGAVRRLAIGATIGPALIVAAAFADGVAQAALWTVALAVDYGGALFGRARGWQVSAAHFAERHALIVIIALGESIVALGVGATEIVLGTRVVVAAVLGVVVIAALWWAYFDVVALVAERKLAEATGRERAALARDSYSYLHLPMVAGIVLFALGLKKTLADVEDPLKTVPAVALCGGLALYLLAHVAFRLRNVRSFNPHRTVAAVALLALLPLVLEVPSLAALALVALVCALLIAYEVVRFREARARVRAAHA